MMMKSLFFTVLAICIISTSAFTQKSQNTDKAKVRVGSHVYERENHTPDSHKPTSKYVTLDVDNMSLIKGVVLESTVDQTLNELLTDTTENDVYVFIDTFGGSVFAGNKLIEVIELLTLQGKNVYCIADTAMSMGFAILQGCPTRYVLESSMLMQHQMSLGTGGEFNKVKSRMNFYNQINRNMVSREADRLGLTVDELNSRTNDEWYLYGNSALDHNAADDVVHVGCTRKLIEMEHVISFMTFIGPVEIVFSRCPLIKSPREVRFAWFDKESDKNTTQCISDINTRMINTPFGKANIHFQQCGNINTPIGLDLTEYNYVRNNGIMMDTNHEDFRNSPTLDDHEDFRQSPYLIR